MAFETVKKNLETRGFTVRVFATGAEAAEYLNSVIDGTTVGIGGSATVRDIGAYELLKSHNTVYWHWKDEDMNVARKNAMDTEVYLSSVNGMAETGEIVNIDGNCNRVSAMCFGHEKVYLIVGKNKLAPDYEAALWRARNIAAPKNAKRLGKNTPCAKEADRCYDCQSPERICRALSVFWEKPRACEFEVILIDEELGY
jgi:L-lactate utilization protein LutB